MAGADGNGGGDGNGDGDRGGSFDSLMASMGVRPLDAPEEKAKGRRKKAKGRKGKKARHPRGRKATQEQGGAARRPRRELTAYEKALREQERKQEAASAKAAQKKKPASKKPVTKKPAASKPAPKKAAAKKPAGKEPAAKKAAGKKAAAKKPAGKEPAAKKPAPPTAPVAADVQALRDRLDALQAERDRLAAALDDRERAAAEARAQAAGLTRALARARGDDAPPLRSVAEVLSERGIKGPTEIDRLLAGLSEARLGADLLATLTVDDSTLLASFLEERTVRLGGCEACPSLPGRVRIDVPRSRCELCGGDDLATGRRRFMDGALVNGITRIAVVGGSAKVHRVLRGLLQDRRLHLVLVPGSLRRSPEAAAAEVTDVQVVLRWSRPDVEDWLLPEVAALYETAPGEADADLRRPPVRDVQADHLAAFLVGAGAALDALLD